MNLSVRDWRPFSMIDYQMENGSKLVVYGLCYRKGLFVAYCTRDVYYKLGDMGLQTEVSLQLTKSSNLPLFDQVYEKQIVFSVGGMYHDVRDHDKLTLYDITTFPPNEDAFKPVHNIYNLIVGRI